MLGVNPIRATKAIRDMVSTTTIDPNFFIMSLVVVPEGWSISGAEIPFVSISELARRMDALATAGVRTVKLFTVGVDRSHSGHESISDKNLTAQSLKIIKRVTPDVRVITETCLCPYTESGSCVLVDENGNLQRDKTNQIFGEIAVFHANHGADVIGPAAMAEGTTTACRNALDADGFGHIPIMSHLIFRSPLYEPYTRAMSIAGSSIRHPFRLETRDARFAVKSALALEKEGSDMILIEPSLFVLDVVAQIREKVNSLLGVFSVSGEYNLLKRNGPAGEVDPVYFEEHARASLRAGADFMVTYAADGLVQRFRG